VRKSCLGIVDAYIGNTGFGAKSNPVRLSPHEEADTAYSDHLYAIPLGHRDAKYRVGQEKERSDPREDVQEQELQTISATIPDYNRSKGRSSKTNQG